MHGTFDVPVCEVCSDDPFARADMALTKAVAETVQELYPGHPWRVEVSHEQGIIKIQLQPFMGAINWHVIKIRNAKNVADLRSRVVCACGEILERYRIPRCRFSRDDFEAAKALVPSHQRFHGFVPT